MPRCFTNIILMGPNLEVSKLAKGNKNESTISIVMLGCCYAVAKGILFVLTCLCRVRCLDSGLSPFEDDDCCRSLVPLLGQSGDDDIILPLDGRG